MTMAYGYFKLPIKLDTDNYYSSVKDPYNCPNNPSNTSSKYWAATEANDGQ